MKTPLAVYLITDTRTGDKYAARSHDTSRLARRLGPANRYLLIERMAFIGSAAAVGIRILAARRKAGIQ